MVFITPLIPNCDLFQFVTKVVYVSDEPVNLSPAASVMNAMEISADSKPIKLTATPQTDMPRSPSIDEINSALFLHRIACYALRLHDVDEAFQIPASPQPKTTVLVDTGNLKPSGV